MIIDVEGLPVEVDDEEYAKNPSKVYGDVLAARAELRLPETHPQAGQYQDPEE